MLQQGFTRIELKPEDKEEVIWAGGVWFDRDHGVLGNSTLVLSIRPCPCPSIRSTSR